MTASWLRRAWGAMPDPAMVAAVAALGAASLAAILLGNGNLAVAAAPILAVLVVVAVAHVPLRTSLLVLAFLALVLENPAEAFASGLWQSPLHQLGSLLLMQLKATLPVNALIITGLDVFLLLFTTVWVVRRVRGSRTDAEGHVATPAPLVWAAIAAYATIAVTWLHGMATGGDFQNSLWQLFRVIYLPGVFLLFSAGLRGMPDAPAMGRVLVAAALVRAVLAVYIRHLFPDLEQMPHTTTHADSMLFANAFLLVLVRTAESPGRRSKVLALLVLPVLVAGMIANNRRLVWVEVAMAMAALALITRWSPLKAWLSRAFILAVPFLLVYVAVGWSHPTGPFAPVRTIRSVVDSSSDGSTRWRDWENYDLYATARKNPILGVGFGQPYEEVVQLPDISANYKLYRFAPHNSILGVLAYGGALGFAGLFLLLPMGVFFAVRSYRFARAPAERVAALTSVGVIVTYLMHLYGDMALGTWTSVFCVGGALALAGKVAVSTGAWPYAARTRAGRAAEATTPAPGAGEAWGGRGRPAPAVRSTT